MDEYLASLLDLPLQRLQRESAIQLEKVSSFEDSLQSLASENYRTILRAPEDVTVVRAEVSKITENLGKLASELKSLQNVGDKFCVDSSQILRDLRKTNATLQSHSQLLELLELPQLTETCVLNGCYDEAVELFSRASHLAKSHKNLKILQQLAEDSENAKRLMCSRLFQTLREEIQLPQCLSVVSYLRRLSLYSELELRWSFLQCRGEYLHKCLGLIIAKDPQQHLSKLTETYRVVLFDAVTHFRAAFSDDVGDESSRLLCSWLLEKLRSYCASLEKNLQHIKDGGALSSILNECLYFAQSLGRVKSDCKQLFLPAFDAAVERLFLRHFEATIVGFANAIKTHNWESQPLTFVPYNVTDTLAPPAPLVDFPPLAVIVNGILSALNDIRQCALASLAESFGRSFSELLKRVASIISASKSRVASGRDESVAAFDVFCQAAAKLCLPYLEHAINTVYPDSVHVAPFAHEIMGLCTRPQAVDPAIYSPKLSESVHSESDSVTSTTPAPETSAPPIDSEQVVVAESADVEVPPQVYEPLKVGPAPVHVEPTPAAIKPVVEKRIPAVVAGIPRPVGVVRATVPQTESKDDEDDDV